MRYLFLIIFVASFIFRLYYVSDFHHAFTIDQARDMLEVRKIVVGHDPVFIGPITSLNGIFLGPFWFYLNVIPFLLGGGNPTALAFFQIIIIYSGIAAFFLYFRKRDESLALWGSFLLLFSPRLFEAGTYSFNANTTPIFVLFSLLLLHSTLASPGKMKLFFLGLLAGLTLQLEAAFGLLIFPLCLIWLLDRRKPLLHFLLGFVLTLMPQILFELKHNFIMARTFITEFSGGSNILGDPLDLATKFTDRSRHYLGGLSGSFNLPPFISLLFPIGIIIIYLLHRRGKIKRNLYDFFLINLSLIALSLLLYFIYPNNLKDWWSINFVIPVILITSIALSRLPQKLLLVLIAAAFPFFVSKFSYRLNERSNDRGLLLNQIEVVDRIYQRANGEGFRVYVFTPAVYDYHYQYLFWWYGQKKFGYLPEKLTYQDNVPSYMENNEIYWQKTKPADFTFLIIEADGGWEEKAAAWREKFSKCSESETLTGNIIIEKLTSCSQKS